VGHPVVSNWIHGGHLRLGELKMAKSKGNIVRIADLEEMGFDPLSFRYLTFQTRYRSEMDFSEESMRGADQHVRRLRRRMAEWAPAAGTLSDAAKDLDARFRGAVADDLDMPRALVVVNEAASSELPGGEKYALLSSWDAVLGLDLEREALQSWQPSDEIRSLVAERDEARAAKDYARSDEIRDRLQAMGLEVMDTAEGTKVRRPG
jgi:cysteinyl-tRNA synthetase